MRPPGCKARQYSDQMHCAECGLSWDVNDPDEPACRPEAIEPKREKPPSDMGERLRTLASKIKYGTRH